MVGSYGVVGVVGRTPGYVVFCRCILSCILSSYNHAVVILSMYFVVIYMLLIVICIWCVIIFSLNIMSYVDGGL